MRIKSKTQKKFNQTNFEFWPFFEIFHEIEALPCSKNSKIIENSKLLLNLLPSDTL